MEMVPCLHKELVHSNQLHNVSTPHILNRLHLTAHHQNGSLDRLQVQVPFLPRCAVEAHDLDLQARGHHPREYSTKGIEAAFVRGWHHLGNVHLMGAFGGHSS